MFADAFRGRRVLVTGHTGFKGSWLAVWLEALGAEVTGFSAYLPSDPCHFAVAQIDGIVRDERGDIRDLDGWLRVVREARPEILFHLAAQPLVRASYADPRGTFETNVMGTVNVLEAVRECASLRCAVLITSDKCYRNDEWPWGYRETDILGGEDPYGGSKAAAELAIHSYVRSFLRAPTSTRVVSVRAGNVIGGGDWAADRIVPDSVRAWAERRPVHLRNPAATRPWQHVLEPLSGYLAVASRLLADGEQHGEAFNFGPGDQLPRSVGELVAALATEWPGAEWGAAPPAEQPAENTLLKLACDKALQRLGWRATLDFDETVRFTADWYRCFYGGEADMRAVTRRQIDAYAALARRRGMAWAS